MGDMSATIIPKSDQINADELVGGPITVTINRAVVKKGDQQPVNLHTVETPGRAYRPSKTMRKLIVEAWGLESQAYVGRSLTLYRNPEIMYGGQTVGGIEISHMSHIDKPVVTTLIVGRGKTREFTVLPIPQQQPAQPAHDIDALIQRANGDSGMLQQLFDWAVDQGAPADVLNRISALLPPMEQPEL